MSVDPKIEAAEATGAISVRGMDCASCVAHVDKAIRALPGIATVNVNLARGRASVTYDASRVGLDRVAAAATGAGYPGSVIADDHSHAAQAHDEHNHAEMHAAGWRRRAVIGVALWAPAEALHWIIWLGGSHPHGVNWLTWFAFATSTFAIGLVGGGFYRSAFAALKRGTTNMDTLIAMGATVAYAYSLVALVGALRGGWILPEHLYFTEASALLALVSVGHWMETRARDRAGIAIRQLLELAPETALLLSRAASTSAMPTVARRSLQVLQSAPGARSNDPEEVLVSTLAINDRVLVKPGMRIPIDGIVESGTSSVDESMLTGESLPVTRAKGHEVAGGTLNRDGALIVAVSRIGSETALAQIVKLVEEAQNAKPAVQRLADRISAIFVPTVLSIAILVGAGWLGYGSYRGWSSTTTWGVVANNVCSVLIVACPCALGIALPAALMVSTGWGARRGILIRSLEALQRGERVKIVVLDKTGTITHGTPSVSSVVPAEGIFERELLFLAASAEMLSEHPLARSIVEHARGLGIELEAPSDFVNEPGVGVHATVGTRQIFVGREGESSAGVVVSQRDALGQLRKLGTMTLSDTVRGDSKSAVASLRAMGCEVVMLTGDHVSTAQKIAGAVGIDRVIAGVRPDGKARAIGELRSKLGRGDAIVMIGDGINDAPALAAADLGIAVGSGADVAKQSAGIVLVGSSLHGAVDAIRLSRITMRKVRQNLFWAFFYNVLAIPAAAFGYLSPTIAALAMALSDVTVIGNALLIRRAMDRATNRTSDRAVNRSADRSPSTPMDESAAPDAGATTDAGKHT